MADNPKGDKKRGSGGPPQLIIRDIEFGKPQPLPESKFEVGLSCLVLVKGEPPREEVTGQVLVNDTPRGNPRLVDARGLFSTKLILEGKAPTISVLLNWRHGTRKVPLGEVELPKLTRRLEFLGGAVRPDDEYDVVLRRVGKDGKSEAGVIAAWYWEKKEDGSEVREYAEWEQADGEDSTIIRILRLNRRQYIEFFLPDDQEVKRSVLIPALRVAEGQPVVDKLAEDISAKARQAGQKFAKDFIAGLKGPVAPAVGATETLPGTPAEQNHLSRPRWWRKLRFRRTSKE